MAMRLSLCTVLAVAALTGSVSAQELTIPTMDYRTGPYAPSGIPFANGQTDYYLMLNERDGGICVKAGDCAKIRVVPCETEYNTQKGVECYEKTKGEGAGALVY